MIANNIFAILNPPIHGRDSSLHKRELGMTKKGKAPSE
jgi:hypothetical protein